ncbi:unnamed protein product [Gongylonema pulchrum]|uniref:Ovule protein n=1 Tax=Gongylonema pulchrum TaxID=637853 RepID=A0A183EMX0_9BILA|nr:unnamed protein product [Gongylonema pulchrum]
MRSRKVLAVRRSRSFEKKQKQRKKLCFEWSALSVSIVSSSRSNDASISSWVDRRKPADRSVPHLFIGLFSCLPPLHHGGPTAPNKWHIFTHI